MHTHVLHVKYYTTNFWFLITFLNRFLRTILTYKERITKQDYLILKYMQGPLLSFIWSVHRIHHCWTVVFTSIWNNYKYKWATLASILDRSLDRSNTVLEFQNLKWINKSDMHTLIAWLRYSLLKAIEVSPRIPHYKP